MCPLHEKAELNSKNYIGSKLRSGLCDGENSVEVGQIIVRIEFETAGDWRRYSVVDPRMRVTFPSNREIGERLRRCSFTNEWLW